MKFFTTYLLLVFSVFAVNAQGNMQFNQVIRTKFTVSSGSSGLLNTVGTISVPQNKVWKIESGSIFHEYNQIDKMEELFVDGQLLFYWIGIDYQSNQINAPFVFNSAPIWLPAGSYPITFRQQPYTTGGPFTIAISALEFNIVP